MKLFAKLGLALFAAFAMLMVAAPSPSDAHGWRRHCHCHHGRTCHRRHVHHKRHHHRHHVPRYHDNDGDDYPAPTTSGSQCKGRIDGIATGQGIFGLGTARARQAAIADFEAKANTLFGASYGSFNRARNVKWDCNKLAIIRAKCVVTAEPCQ